MDVPDAAGLLGISVTTAYDRIRRGAFPVKVIKVGRRYRVVTADLRRLLGLDDAGGSAQSHGDDDE
jgi:predicted site-specific integrase-resolvase